MGQGRGHSALVEHLTSLPRRPLGSHSLLAACALLPASAAIPLPQKEMAAGREVASALLDLFLTAEETSQASC
jgi:hypothetical protein